MKSLARKGPSGELVLPQASPFLGEFPVIYVETSGSDANTGLTQSSPLRTIRAARELAKFSSVHSTILLGRGEFDCEGMFDLDLPAKSYSLVGAEFDTLQDDLVVASYNSATRTITFTTDPGWDNDEFLGAFLQWKSGAVNVIPKARTKTIKESGSNTISLTYPPFNENNQSVQVGDVYRIVKPAATLTGATSPLTTKVFQGGSPTMVSTKDSISSSDQVTISNLDIVAELDEDTETCFAYGWIAIGVRFLSSFNRNWLINFTQGFLGSGNFNTGAQSDAGWCITNLNTGGFRNPELMVSEGGSELYSVGGRLIAKNSLVYWLGGRVIDTGDSFPHGAVCAVDGAHIFTFDSPTVGRFLIQSEQGHDLVCENNSLIEIQVAITHQGTSGFMRSRYNSNMKLTQDVVVGAGASSPTLFAEYGGQIRLETAGANLGAATAGASVALGQVTRGAAVWNPGDAVCGAANIPRDLANIYRT